MGIIVLSLTAAALIALYLVVKRFDDKKIQKNAEQILDDRFDGSDTATYRVSGTRGLKFEQVLSGAEKRGYTLHAQNQDTKKLTTLVFKKDVPH